MLINDNNFHKLLKSNSHVLESSVRPKLEFDDSIPPFLGKPFSLSETVFPFFFYKIKQFILNYLFWLILINMYHIFCVKYLIECRNWNPFIYFHSCFSYCDPFLFPAIIYVFRILSIYFYINNEFNGI